MKKYLLGYVFLFSVFYTLFANATSINIESVQNFYPSQGIVDSRVINISITDNVDNSFSLVLPEDANIRFSSDFSAIKISGNGSSKVGTGITLMPSLTVLKFNLDNSLVSGDNLIIDGLKLVVYSKPQGDRYIGLDLNGDNIADVLGFNGYRTISTVAYSDQLAPSDVFNLTGSIVDNKLTVSANMPGDPDFQAIVLDNLDSAGKVLSSFFRYDLNNFAYDLQEGFDSIRVKTVDIRANYSNGLTYKLDLFRAKKSVIIDTPVDNNVCIQVIAYAINNKTGVCESFSTPCSIPAGYTKVETCEVKVVEKYSPTYIKYNVLYKITGIIDTYITKNLVNASIEKSNKIMIMRNDLINILERLDTASKDEIYGIADEFKALFAEIKVQIK